MNATAPERDFAAPGADSPPLSQIQGRGLTKRYEMRTVLREIDLAIHSGECVVLFGPNGAGKTTLIRVLSTLTRAQRGSLCINDVDASESPNAARAQIGVVAHQPYLYDSLTARENLQFFARLYDVPDRERRIDSVLRKVELHDRADDRVGTFSRGMVQRVALARAILHQPTILLFDEPDTGLDIASVRVLERILGDHCRAGGSILTTTHDIAFGLRIASRVLMMVRGAIVADEPVDQIDTASIEATMSTPGA